MLSRVLPSEIHYRAFWSSQFQLYEHNKAKISRTSWQICFFSHDCCACSAFFKCGCRLNGSLLKWTSDFHKLICMWRVMQQQHECVWFLSLWPPENASFNHRRSFVQLKHEQLPFIQAPIILVCCLLYSDMFLFIQPFLNWAPDSLVLQLIASNSS